MTTYIASQIKVMLRKHELSTYKQLHQMKCLFAECVMKRFFSKNVKKQFAYI